MMFNLLKNLSHKFRSKKMRVMEIENIRFGLVQDLDIPTYIRRPDLVAKCNVDLETNNQSRGIPK
jgi:hypothetical protein